MPDRLQVVIVTPTDPALPLDYQGVALRRKAIDAMSKIAKVDENSVRYHGVTNSAVLQLDAPIGVLSVWQHDSIAVRFFADGEVRKENWGGNYTEVDGRTKLQVTYNRDY